VVTAPDVGSMVASSLAAKGRAHEVAAVPAEPVARRVNPGAGTDSQVKEINSVLLRQKEKTEKKKNVLRGRRMG